MQHTHHESPVGEGLQTLPPFGPLRALGIHRRPFDALRAVQKSARALTSITIAATNSRRGAACCARGRNGVQACATSDVLRFSRIEHAQQIPACQVPRRP
jgi:hypothetical protein